MWQSECNFSGKEPDLSFKEKSYFDIQYDFVRDMVEEKKVFLMKVENLNNVVDSLTKSVSTDKFSWCRASMSSISLDCWLCNPVTPYMQRKQQVGECWVCVIFFA